VSRYYLGTVPWYCTSVQYCADSANLQIVVSNSRIQISFYTILDSYSTIGTLLINDPTKKLVNFIFKLASK